MLSLSLFEKLQKLIGFSLMSMQKKILPPPTFLLFLPPSPLPPSTLPSPLLQSPPHRCFLKWRSIDFKKYIVHPKEDQSHTLDTV